MISTCISQNLYAEDGWKMVKNSDGIEVYVRPHKNSNIDECKGIITIPASMDIILRLMSDAPLSKKYIYSCYEGVFIKPWEKGHVVHYFAFKVPWPYWNRDIVYDTQAKINPELNRVIIHMRAVKEALVPYREKHVRMTDSEVIWILEKISPNKTRVMYHDFYDPVGIPPFLVNLFIEDDAYYSLKNLRYLVIDSVKDSSYKTLVCPEIPISAEVNNKDFIP
ncbi:MAG: hypothetical protein APR62_08335 [Smithella sp. SDB]|nr:MAG: hypothetical protein APR62_08335 [Smithella sp. SDB]